MAVTVLNDANVVALTVKGFSPQTSPLTEWRTSTDSFVCSIDNQGNVKAVAFLTTTQYAKVAEENSGGIITLTKATSTVTAPGSGKGTLYLRDGTTTDTLKLVIRAGGSGAENTLFDNISQSGAGLELRLTGDGLTHTFAPTDVTQTGEVKDSSTLRLRAKYYDAASANYDFDIINNQLTASPPASRLEFRNDAGVVILAVHSETTGAAQGIAVGTTTFVSGAKITIDGGGLYFATDASFDIGGPTSRPRDLNLGRTLNVSTSANADIKSVDIAATWNFSSSPLTLIRANVTEQQTSHASSLLLDLQVGGSSKFKIDKKGFGYGALYSWTALSTDDVPNDTNPSYLAASGPSGSVSNSANRDAPMVRNSEVTVFQVTLKDAPGVGKTRTFTILNNGTETGASVAISGTSMSGSWSGQEQFDAGERIVIKCTASGTPALTRAQFGISLRETP